MTTNVSPTSDLMSHPLSAVPDERGRFGEFGRRYVPETLMYALDELTAAYAEARKDPAFQKQLHDLLTHYVGRPNPLYFAERLTEKCGGAKIYFKREDLNLTGAHKINNTIGQVLLTKRMGKTRVIAETGAVSMESRRPPPVRGLVCRVLCIWARKMFDGRN